MKRSIQRGGSDQHRSPYYVISKCVHKYGDLQTFSRQEVYTSKQIGNDNYVVNTAKVGIPGIFSDVTMDAGYTMWILDIRYQ